MVQSLGGSIVKRVRTGISNFKNCTGSPKIKILVSSIFPIRGTRGLLAETADPESRPGKCGWTGMCGVPGKDRQRILKTTEILLGNRMFAWSQGITPLTGINRKGGEMYLYDGEIRQGPLQTGDQT